MQLAAIVWLEFRFSKIELVYGHRLAQTIDIFL